VLLQPALTFDRGPLHLESRYNSEDRDTFSLFLGWNLGWGQDLKLQLTTMLGALADRTKGIAPEFDLTLIWGQFKLSGELDQERPGQPERAEPSENFSSTCDFFRNS